MLTLAVMLAAGLGALARYVLDEIVEHRSDIVFPAGTLLVNVTGSFVLGLVTGLALHHGLARIPTLVVGTGFAGGYTTFSTWVWESMALVENREHGAAALNVVGSFALGLAAAAAGLALALV